VPSVSVGPQATTPSSMEIRETILLLLPLHLLLLQPTWRCTTAHLFMRIVMILKRMMALGLRSEVRAGL
jgi:hypothetical protein